MNRPPIIGITGPARSGKDTAAALILARYGGYRYSFADPMRAMLRAGFGIDMEDPYWQDHKEDPIPVLGRSPRYLLQTLGTEWGRDLVTPGIWRMLATQKFESFGHGMVIPDVRFEDEAQLVRKHGVLIHIERKSAAQVASHSSEAGVELGPSDLMLDNNGSMDELRHQIEMLFV